jgi:two-component system OmpR family sensor kinase
MRELQGRKTGSTALVLHPPEAPWICRADPDAVGIILGNLFDNALKYADGPLPVTVDARTPGRVRIINDCSALAPKDLAAITRRFVRRTEMSGGFGLGLSIVQDLCAQSGCTLEIRSPVAGSARGFSAELVLPPQDARRTP